MKEMPTSALFSKPDNSINAAAHTFFSFTSSIVVARWVIVAQNLNSLWVCKLIICDDWCLPNKRHFWVSVIDFSLKRIFPLSFLHSCIIQREYWFMTSSKHQKSAYQKCLILLILKFSNYKSIKASLDCSLASSTEAYCEVSVKY